MDNLTKKQRSHCMSRIQAQDTEPETVFRKYIWKKGYRGYRVKNKIEGSPDIYFPVKEVAVFIDGCFWHKCKKCFIRPKSNRKYWDKKIERNAKRDKRINQKLKLKGVKILRFWEHEVKQDLAKCFKKFKEVYAGKKKHCI